MQENGWTCGVRSAQPFANGFERTSLSADSEPIEFFHNCKSFKSQSSLDDANFIRIALESLFNPHLGNVTEWSRDHFAELNKSIEWVEVEAG